MNKPANNVQIGSNFERKVQQFFANHGLNLKPRIKVKIGIRGTKPHAFDLGDSSKKVLVECKAHRWTKSGNLPIAKMTTWNEAMFFFLLAPRQYRKIFCVMKDCHPKTNKSLAQYYIRTNRHLIPKDVEIWEFDTKKDKVCRLQ